ncbi:MAG: cation:proton antiporter [Gammaproteobacteria bacterium]|nr:cation:proton antiporter [Gammaproteobacteria bacterium]
MHDPTIIYSVFLIFAGTALVATVALFARQSMLIAYILVGIAAGPSGFNLVTDVEMIKQIAHVGIIFLLFLLGMNLEPRELARFFRTTTVITLISSFLFFATGAVTGLLCGFSPTESIVIGVSMMFSSTIIGLKLLPTTTLHQQHMGEIMISILLLQDIIAIIVLLGIQGSVQDTSIWWGFGRILLALPLLIGFAFLISRYLIQALLARFDRIQEYIFLLTIGWCLFISQLGQWLGLSYEIGAFIGGVSLAISPISRFITERMKPVRDFFLVMFFFSLGASFNLDMAKQLLIPALIVAVLMMLLKPLVFAQLLVKQGEKTGFSRQAGVRLGQISEFSLLIAVLALETRVISAEAASLIQIATLLTFIASSYYIVVRYPTPIAVDDKLRKD